MPPTQRDIEQQRAKAQAIKERAAEVEVAARKVVLDRNKVTAKNAKEAE